VVTVVTPRARTCCLLGIDPVANVLFEGGKRNLEDTSGTRVRLTYHLSPGKNPTHSRLFGQGTLEVGRFPTSGDLRDTGNWIGRPHGSQSFPTRPGCFLYAHWAGLGKWELKTPAERLGVIQTPPKKFLGLSACLPFRTFPGRVQALKSGGQGAFGRLR